MVGEDPRASGAVEPADSLAAAARKAVAAQLAKLEQHEPGTRLGLDAEELHQMRVATRRLRAAARFFEPAFRVSTRRALAVELRWLAGLLGAVRDLDVQLELLTVRHSASGAGGGAEHDSSAEPGASSGDPLMAELREWLADERDARRAELQGALDSVRYRRLLARLDAIARGRERLLVMAERSPVAVHGAAAVEKAQRRVVKHGRRIGKQPRAEELHELRIRAKRLRYVLEMVAALTGRSGRRLVRDLAELQEVLGMHQDACVAWDVLTRFIEAADPDEAAMRAVGVAPALAREHQRALSARASFARAWKRFAGKRTARHLDEILDRLRAPEMRQTLVRR